MEKKSITIGRQFGCGGRELGRRVAQTRSMAYYDKELLAVAARESGLDQSFLESRDEPVTNSFLYSLAMGQPNAFFPGTAGTSLEQLAADAQRAAILQVADRGPCVIVGRCADAVLKDRPGTLRVFVWAEEADRVSRVMRRERLGEEDARKKLARMDKVRRSYYESHCDGSWGAANNYDLCLNLSSCGMETAVQLIAAF